jgi:ABC-type lipoprotein export system ATPase subunit
MSYIKKIEICQFLGELDLNWSLDPKVNILIGKNGSGKTTLLRLLKQIMKPSHGACLASGIESIRIELNNNKYIYASQNLFVLQKVNLCYINTFDQYQQDFENSKGHPETELDVVLEPLINDWKSYLLKLKILAEKVTVEFDEQIRHISTKKSADDNDLQKLKQLLNDKIEQINNINFYKNRFIEQINALFSDSHKRIDFDKNNAIIFRNHHNQSFSVYELSAGEKQMLIILLNVLIQENKPSIILIDEPEISLHLAWQLDLIDMIQSLNDNCQLIIVTHAAGVFNKGWKDKITKIENITSTIEEHDLH